MLLPLGLILLGLVAPSLVTVADFRILELIREAILTGDNGLLLMASARLVLLNTLRALPHYLGVFLLAEVFVTRMGEKGLKKWLALLGCLALVPAVYLAIEELYGICYDFGSPALISLLGITALHRMVNYRSSIWNKAVILVLILAAVQWLDVVPALTPYGFGRGEVSLDIKKAAAFLGGEAVLTLIGIAFFLTCSFSALALAQLIVSYNKELVLVETAKKQEEELYQARLQALRSRGAAEIQALVHDLKTPLTTIQGLTGVIQLRSTDGKIIEYARYIEQCVDKMNDMIAEILHPDTRHLIHPEELLKFTMAHLSAYRNSSAVHLAIAPGLPPLYGNRIRLTRALVNFIENALDAIPEEKGRVDIILEREGDDLAIWIIDNGPGLPAEMWDRIWEMGFSTKNSMGLGLPFARTVIEEHGGTVTLSSRPGEGCRFKILLPGGDTGGGQAGNPRH